MRELLLSDNWSCYKGNGFDNLSQLRIAYEINKECVFNEYYVFIDKKSTELVKIKVDNIISRKYIRFAGSGLQTKSQSFGTFFNLFLYDFYKNKEIDTDYLEVFSEQVLRRETKKYISDILSRYSNYEYDLYKIISRLAKAKSYEPIKEKVLITNPITGRECSIQHLSKVFKVKYCTLHSRLYVSNYNILRSLDISFIIHDDLIKINKSKYNLTVDKRTKKGKDVFECVIHNEDGTDTFRIMTYDMIDQYCLEQYKKLHKIN